MPVIEGHYVYSLNSWEYVEFIDLNDAIDGYDNCLSLIMTQTRWVLDNMDYIKEFEVPWLNYSGRQQCAKDGRMYAVSAPYFHEKKTRYVSQEKAL